MVHAVRMPKPGQMTEECVLTSWHKRVGDPVRKGDVLFEIETDKSAMEVESFVDGVLLKRLAEEGAIVPVNEVCGYVGDPGEAIPEEAPAPPAGESVPEPAVAAPEPRRALAAAASPARLAISPRASRLAAESGLDPRTIAGSGPDGRIVERDVRATIAAGTTAPTAPAPARTTAPAAPAAAVDGEEAPRPLGRMRRVIAERLTYSATTIPHFTVTVAVDVTALLALRQDLKAAGGSLTVTDFVLAATAQTLAEFPDVNSRTDGISVWPRRRVHLGVAVSLPGGLVVPVVRDADRLPIGELHDQVVALASAARAGTLPPDEMAGSTFTVSNLGMYGVDEFSAIINPGEGAILAVASAVPTAVAIGDGLAVRTIMKMTLSADHRLVDGELGARFLGAVRRRLEDAASFRNEALNA